MNSERAFSVSMAKARWALSSKVSTKAGAGSRGGTVAKSR